MRVIAGSAKGTRLAPVPPGTRPLSDRAREGLFSSLGPAVDGATVLDLYAGTGALGIEALSRGGEHAAFVDRSQAALRTIRANLDLTKLAGRAAVVRADVPSFLDKTPKPCDIVVLDPPYATAIREIEAVLGRLAEGWLAPRGTVALTRPKKGYSFVIPVKWQVARRLEYGDALVFVYREE